MVLYLSHNRVLDSTFVISIIMCLLFSSFLSPHTHVTILFPIPQRVYSPFFMTSISLFSRTYTWQQSNW